MMSTETERNATTNHQGEDANAQAAPSSSGNTHVPPKKSTEPKLPSLSGKYSYIKSLCVSQRPYLGKVMADHSITMFKTCREIVGCDETLET